MQSSTTEQHQLRTTPPIKHFKGFTVHIKSKFASWVWHVLYWGREGRVYFIFLFLLLQVAPLFNRLRLWHAQHLSMCSNKYDSFSRTHCSPYSSHRLYTCHCSWIFHHVQTANRFVPAKQAGTDCPGESAVEARRTGPRHGRPENIYNVETAKS